VARQGDGKKGRGEQERDVAGQIIALDLVDFSFFSSSMGCSE
jgi:hypothetical protein